MLKIDWRQGPEYPLGIQDSAFGIIAGNIVSAGGFSRYPKDVVSHYPDTFAGGASGFTGITFAFDPASPTPVGRASRTSPAPRGKPRRRWW